MSRPRISGFSMIRNGVKFDYPFVESYQSLLPWVDELVIAVGKGDDETYIKLLEWAESPRTAGKIRLIETIWPLEDAEKRKSGLILSEQTNLALDQCKNDWCFYLQADEVLHEQDLPRFFTVFDQCSGDPEVEGFVFDYIHFYGSYNVVQETRSAYRREVRCIRKSAGLRSIGDAQSFRKLDGEKPKVVSAQARVFHYGWVRTPDAMKEKTYFMDQLYHGKATQEQAENQIPHSGDNYRYKRFWGLKLFKGTHPEVMRERILKKGWNWDLEKSDSVWSIKDLKKMVLDTVESLTGKRLFEYRSYRLLKRERS